MTCGHRLRYIRLQATLHTVTGCATYGCRLRYVRLQAVATLCHPMGSQAGLDEAAQQAEGGAVGRLGHFLHSRPMGRHRYGGFVLVGARESPGGAGVGVRAGLRGRGRGQGSGSGAGVRSRGWGHGQGHGQGRARAGVRAGVRGPGQGSGSGVLSLVRGRRSSEGWAVWGRCQGQEQGPAPRLAWLRSSLEHTVTG